MPARYPLPDHGSVENLIAYGGSVKILEQKGDLVTVGGPGVVFDDRANPVKDLTGEYFTADTYYGAHKGDGMDTMFHHGVPVHSVKFAKALSEHIFPPVHVDEDEAALVGSVILDLRKDYLQRFVYEQAEQKTLSWSTGALSHGVLREDDGWLKRWIIGEWSFTPTPAEPRTAVVPFKSLLLPDTASARALKAESLNARIGRIESAFRSSFPASDSYYPWIAETFDDHVIADIRGTYYRIPYAETEGAITFADAPQWEKVERTVEWEAAKAQQETIKALDALLEYTDSILLDNALDTLITQTGLTATHE